MIAITFRELNADTTHGPFVLTVTYRNKQYVSNDLADITEYEDAFELATTTPKGTA